MVRRGTLLLADMVTIRTILVTTDLSPFSLSAISYATTMRLAFGARLHLLHVLEEKKGSAGNGTGSREEALLELRAIVARLEGPEPICCVREGDPAGEICRYARETGIDMIILATHGRTGLRHMVMGSVAERVVRRACVPVLTVKPPALAESFLREEDVERELHLC